MVIFPNINNGDVPYKSWWFSLWIIGMFPINNGDCFPYNYVTHLWWREDYIADSLFLSVEAVPIEWSSARRVAGMVPFL